MIRCSIYLESLVVKVWAFQLKKAEWLSGVPRISAFQGHLEVWHVTHMFPAVKSKKARCHCPSYSFIARAVGALCCVNRIKSIHLPLLRQLPVLSGLCFPPGWSVLMLKHIFFKITSRRYYSAWLKGCRRITPHVCQRASFYTNVFPQKLKWKLQRSNSRWKWLDVHYKTMKKLLFKRENRPSGRGSEVLKCWP